MAKVLGRRPKNSEMQPIRDGMGEETVDMYEAKVITVWNDASNRKQEEVEAAFEKAIKLCPAGWIVEVPA
jgi:hypothetical protein